MFNRSGPRSLLCPGCGQLVGIDDERCLNCGRVRPGLWGLGPWLSGLGRDFAFLPIVTWSCLALFIASVIVSAEGMGAAGLLGLDPRALLLFGASGQIPVFELDRWWTVLSASYLHAGLLHIAFNMMSARDLIPTTTHFYGGPRTVIIYTFAGVAGFLASSVAGEYLHGLPFLSGAPLTVGASASLFGLVGALIYAGRRMGATRLRQQLLWWAVGWIVFGFIVRFVDNWAHIGGFAGGYLLGRWLDPASPERGDHVVVAIACLVATVLALIASPVLGLKVVRALS